MDISAAMAAHLSVLTQSLSDLDIDLEAELAAFTIDVKRAVTSYTGMKMTIACDGQNVSFTVHDDHTSRETATTLRIPLSVIARTEAQSTLLLYAATPGAFVDLAADLSYALGIDPAALILDGHLPSSDEGSGVTGLEAHFAIDQAIGVLIGRGHTPESARDELHRLAGRNDRCLRGAAEQIILAAGGGSTDIAGPAPS